MQELREERAPQHDVSVAPFLDRMPKLEECPGRVDNDLAHRLRQPSRVVTHVVRVLPPALAPPRVGEHPQLDDNDSPWLLLRSRHRFGWGTKFFKLENQEKNPTTTRLRPADTHFVVVVPTREWMFNLIPPQHQSLWGNLMNSRLHQTLECKRKQSFTLTTVKIDCGTTTSQMSIDGRDKDLESEYSHREMSLAGMSDRRTRLRLRLATPQSKPKHSNPPNVTIWDALVVGVGFIQLIGSLWEHAASHSNNAPVIGTVAAAAQQQKGLLPYFWNHLKAIFHLLLIFGPLVYLRNSADEFKREMIVGERNYDDDNKHARRTKNTYHLEQEVTTTTTRQKQRQKSSLLSRSNFLCCRRELVAAAAVGSAAVLSVVSAICKLLLLSFDRVMVVEKSHLSDCAVALESASVHI